MTWRLYAVLGALGLALAAAVSRLQSFPGYLDSDYYFGGGMQLARGQGFTEPYLWNYLDDPVGLPHPSHSYWMPMASLITAAGMWITGGTTYEDGRLGFLLLAALSPILTARLAWEFSRQRFTACIAGLLAVFSIYYAPFLPVPDNYGIYISLGALFLLSVGDNRAGSFAARGLLAGAMTLARSDGLIWLAMAWVTALPAIPNAADRASPDAGKLTARKAIGATALRWGLATAGFLVITGPWFLRNLAVHGTPMAPGGERLLWLTSYNETFAYPSSQITFARWLSQGWVDIALDRLSALRWNLLNAMAAQGGLFLLPFIAVGAWERRRDPRVRIGVLAWMGILFAMTVVFPFAGARGGFFHAGASTQPLWWSLAPLGLGAAVRAARSRGMFTPSAFQVFGSALVGIAMLMTAAILWVRVIPGWGEGEHQYPRVEAELARAGAGSKDIVMVRNPPGYYIMTGRQAIVVPFAEPAAILEAARRFGADYLVLEPTGAAGPIRDVYDGEGGASFQLISELDDIRIYRISP